MGDRKIQEKPILPDLEDLYQGIPDESVNLTFGDLAEVNPSDQKRKPNTTTITTTTINDPTLAKIPSLDFSKGLQASIQQHHHNQDFGHGASSNIGGHSSPWSHSGHGRLEGNQFSHASVSAKSKSTTPRSNDHLGYSMSYDGDMSVASGRGTTGGGGGRRRPGIPHTKICTICNTYVYVLRTRCLVSLNDICVEISILNFFSLIVKITYFTLFSLRGAKYINSLYYKEKMEDFCFHADNMVTL